MFGQKENKFKKISFENSIVSFYSKSEMFYNFYNL